MRKLALTFAVTGSLLLAACGGSDSSDTASGDTEFANAAECAAGKTLTEGTLTVGTGDPAYYPWVIDDKPESKEGFEAAVAYAVAAELGFEDSAVKWVRTTFDEAIQPGAKNFDFNLQQYSITEERKQTVTFSDSYFTTNQAIVGLDSSAAKGATTLADLKKLKLGAQAGTTSLDYITNVIQPDSEPLAYDDNAGAKAALEANQIDAAVFDLPTALYVSAVEIEGSSVLGQFPVQEGVAADEFGLVFDKDNALAECVNLALATLKENGSLASITAQWLSTSTNIPVIK